MFRNCHALKNVHLGRNIIEIGSGCFTSSAIERLDFPDSLEVIRGVTFTSCNDLKFYNFLSCSSIPVLENRRSISEAGDNFVIMTPSTLYQEWCQATNWSYFSDHIVPINDIVEFKVDVFNYIADSNQTWEQFIASPLCLNSFTIKENSVYFVGSDGTLVQVLSDAEPVSTSDVIEPKTYSTLH
jgi:hypothetical protein